MLLFLDQTLGWSLPLFSHPYLHSFLHRSLLVWIFAALVMIAVVYGLVLSIGQLVALAAGSLPAQLRLLLTITLEVFLMTYVLMPRLTRWLAWWIYPSAKTPVDRGQVLTGQE